MDYDLADPLVDPTYCDVLRRERNNLSANLNLPVVIGNDDHSVANLAPVGIARIASCRGRT